MSRSNGFGREQQGDIVRDYFFALKQLLVAPDLTAWEPYLHEVRQPPA